VTLAMTRLRALPLTGTPLTTTRSRASLLEIPGFIRRASALVGEALTLVAIVLCVPFVILAIGLPIALLVRLLLWVGGGL
jgi:hypothetical protein